MGTHRHVKSVFAVALLAAACTSAPRPRASTEPTSASVRAPRPPAPRPGPSGTAEEGQRRVAPELIPPTRSDLDAVRSLLDRGPVLLVRDPDRGVDARITLIARAQAPASTVRRVIATPGEYMTFMPTLRSVDVLSRHERHTAFRFHVDAPIFNVTALCNLHDLGDRRVDVAIVQSETGPGVSRWDLHPDGEGATVLALTTRADPSQGHWLLRQLARRSPSAVAGMNVSADTVLALGVARRAELLSGSSLPLRPAQGAVEPGPLEPPPTGPWSALTRDATLVAYLLTPEGAVRQVTVASWTSASPDAVRARLTNVTGYGRVWGSIREAELVGTPTPERVRYRLVVDTPISHQEGEQELTVQGNTVVQSGLTGDFTGVSHRWDLTPMDGGTLVTLTGGSDYNRAGWLTRLLMNRDPWMMAGFAGSWKIVWLRHLLQGL